MTAIGSDSVHLSIKCRCSCIITYQCTSASIPWSSLSSGSSRDSSGSDLTTANEIPVFCYSCGHLVSKLYRNTMRSTETGVSRELTPTVRMDIHPQQHLNGLLAAQVRSLVSPIQTQIPDLRIASTDSLSSLPKLDPADDTLEFSDEHAQSPSARPGTILPMY